MFNSTWPVLVFEWPWAQMLNHNECLHFLQMRNFLRLEVIFSGLEIYFERSINDQNLSGNCCHC